MDTLSLEGLPPSIKSILRTALVYLLLRGDPLLHPRNNKPNSPLWLLALLALKASQVKLTPPDWLTLHHPGHTTTTLTNNLSTTVFPRARPTLQDMVWVLVLEVLVVM